MLKGKMKCLMGVGLAVLLSLTMLAACSGVGGKETANPSAPPDKSDNSGTDTGEEVYENGLPKNEKVTLKYGFFQGGLGRDHADHAIKTFEEKYPNVKIEITASPDIPSILSTKIAANNADDMFDSSTASLQVIS